MSETSHRRVGALMRTLFEILMSSPDGLPAPEALARLAGTFPLTPQELAPDPSGEPHFEAVLGDAAQEALKAGWLQQEQGAWQVTDEGREAYGRLTDPKAFYEGACQLARQRTHGAPSKSFDAYKRSKPPMAGAIPPEAPEFSVQRIDTRELSISAVTESGTGVKVWFGTDRNRVSDAPRPALSFGSDRSAEDDPLSLGHVEVSIPSTHQEGDIERPSWWRLEFSEDPDKHMVVRSLQVLDQAEWVQDAAHAGAEGLLFVHGFNVTFEEAVLRAAQLAFDLKFAGVPLCYSWASVGDTEDYIQDEQTVEWSTDNLRRFLELVTTKLGLKTLHVICHSMGNRALTRVLSQWAEQPGQAPIGQVVLAAPDVDTGLFKQLVARFKPEWQVTLYASRTDRAILASRLLHDNPRAGDAKPPCVMPRVVTVDVSSAGAQMLGLGHSYFAAASTVFTDLYYLLRNVPVDQRKSVCKAPSGGYFVLP